MQLPDFDAMAPSEIDAWASDRGIKVDGRWRKERMIAHVTNALADEAASVERPAAEPARVVEVVDKERDPEPGTPDDLSRYLDALPNTVPTWVYGPGGVARIIHMSPNAPMPRGWSDAPPEA